MAAPFMLVRDLVAHLQTLDQQMPVVAFNAHQPQWRGPDASAKVRWEKELNR